MPGIPPFQNGVMIPSTILAKQMKIQDLCEVSFGNNKGQTSNAPIITILLVAAWLKTRGMIVDKLQPALPTYPHHIARTTLLQHLG